MILGARSLTFSLPSFHLFVKRQFQKTVLKKKKQTAKLGSLQSPRVEGGLKKEKFPSKSSN